MEDLVFHMRRKLGACKLSKRLAQKCALAHGRFTCMAGLPKPMIMTTKVTVVLCSDKVEFHGNGMQFDLERDQITDVSIKLGQHIPKHLLSGVGKSIRRGMSHSSGKAMFHFESLKRHRNRKTGRCLVFTFTQGQCVDYIVLSAGANPAFLAAQKFQAEFQKVLV